jgi:hypothetical protein
MTRYYFHIRHGKTFIRDEEGMECVNLRAAEVEAHASARDAAKATLYVPSVEPTSIEIEDEFGYRLGAITFQETRH